LLHVGSGHKKKPWDYLFKIGFGWRRKSVKVSARALMLVRISDE
jgi:hypothetical protein